MTRSTPEWIGRTPDTKIPGRVRARVFMAHGGVCHISGIKIRPGDQWDCDHVLALCNGGENRESNLAPALRREHRRKTAKDVAQKKKDARVRSKHIGTYKAKTKIPGGKESRLKKKIDGTVVPR